MSLYAYTRSDLHGCKHCGKDHYYITNAHIIITGTKKELKDANFSYDIVKFDKSKSDIALSQNVFEMHPEMHPDFKHEFGKAV